MNTEDVDPAEVAAIALGNDKKALHKRLKDGARVLTGQATSKWTFNFATKTLTNGAITVQWAVRREADKPIDYDNQQTTIGCCFIVFNPTN